MQIEHSGHVTLSTAQMRSVDAELEQLGIGSKALLESGVALIEVIDDEVVAEEGE